jgi:hypothetical protein
MFDKDVQIRLSQNQLTANNSGESTMDTSMFKLNKPASIWGKGTLMTLAMTLMLQGCGGSDNQAGNSTAPDNSTPEARSGEVMITLTDAEGDFLAYEVDVESIALVKANGAGVETVPLSTRVDFVEYTDLTELFTIKTLPEGVYSQVSLKLNFSQANIVLQDENGESHTASALDDDGQPLSQYEVTLNLVDGKPLVVQPGLPATLALDFDLEASNTILSWDPATVYVEPVLLASVQLDQGREHRARGLLQTVDADNNQFTMSLQPFRQQAADWGEVSVQVIDTTDYEINGASYSGAEGLAVLAQLEAETPLLVQGAVGEERSYTAATVVAGTSVPWVGRTTVRGIVIARDGDVLTLRGSHVERSNGSAVFHDDIQVTLGDATTVTGPTLEGTLDKDAVAVGQRVIVFGELTGATPSEWAMDASSGHVRMMMNLIKGQVVSLQPLVLDLRWVNGRPPVVFDFSGSDLVDGTDPAAYWVDTASLSLEGIDVGEWVKVRGFPSAHGAGPEDFAARTLIDINEDQRAGTLAINWLRRGSSAPILSMTDTALVFDTEEAKVFAKQVGIPFDRDGMAMETVTLVPFTDQVEGIYAIRLAGDPAIELYSGFAEFATALSSRLSAGDVLLKRVVSVGRYEPDTATMQSAVTTARLTGVRQTPDQL